MRSKCTVSGAGHWTKLVKTCWCWGPSLVNPGSKGEWGNVPIKVHNVSFLPPGHFLLTGH